MFAVWPQTSCHNELTRALVLAYVYRHWKWRNSGRYECIYNITCWVYTPHSLFRQWIPPSLKLCRENKVLWPHTQVRLNARVDSERLDGPRQALSTFTHRWRHSIRHVTRIVTHTMDVNNRHGGSNYRCQACTFTIKRFHNGSCAVGVSLYTDHFLTKTRELGKDKFYRCYNHRDNEPYFSPFLFRESLHYWNER